MTLVLGTLYLVTWYLADALGVIEIRGDGQFSIGITAHEVRQAERVLLLRLMSAPNWMFALFT